MCLTVPNAARDLDHREVAPPARGYARTRRHAGFLMPGDLWRPGPGGQPHTVTGVVHHNGSVTPTHRYRAAYRYPTDGLIPTAVPDLIATVLVPLRRAD
jgi:hypothetical protein